MTYEGTRGQETVASTATTKGAMCGVVMTMSTLTPLLALEQSRRLVLRLAWERSRAAVAMSWTRASWRLVRPTLLHDLAPWRTCGTATTMS